MELKFTGGLHERDDINIRLEECIEGKNFQIDAHASTWRPRLPFDLKGTAPNGVAVSGIAQLIKRDNTDSLLVFAGSNVYSVNDDYAFTDVGDITTSTGMRGSYWSLDDRLIITDLDKLNKIHNWNGSTYEPNKHGIGNGTVTTATGYTGLGTSMHITHNSHGLSANDLVTISNVSPTGWNGEHIVSTASANGFTFTVSSSLATATGMLAFEKSVDLYAKYALTWNGRVWLFNITTDSTDNPHMILASEYENPDVFDTSQRADIHTSGGYNGNEAFYMLTPDLKPINGVALFFNTVIISTIDGRLFKITGSDITDYRIVEYYPGSAATGRESITNTGNDIMWMKRGGKIDSLSAVETSGDVQADDLSRWIPNTASNISDSIAVYDEQRQLIHWFVNGKILTLNKLFLSERPDLSPWSVYETLHPYNFDTNCAVYIRIPGSNNYDVFFGGAGGELFKLNGTENNGDAGTYSIVNQRKYAFVDNNVFPSKDTNILGRVEYRKRGQADLALTFDWAEPDARSQSIVLLSGQSIDPEANFWGGDNYYDNGIYYSEGSAPSNKVSTKGFSPPGKGRGFFLNCELDTKVNFLINKLML